MTISLARFHLGTMADAAMYFIRHDEAQLHSTWGALGQIGLKSPRHYLSCLLEQEIACTGPEWGPKKGLPFSSAHADRAEHTSWSATKDLLDCISTARRQNQSSLWPELGLGDVLGCSHGGNDP
jgi:hypothetical protein